MSLTHLFPEFPDDARLWVYVAERHIDDEKADSFMTRVGEFFQSWQSHGRPVIGAAELLDRRLLLVAGYVEGGAVSGCGIDASTHALNEAAHAEGIAWDSPLSVYFRDRTGEIRSTDRPTFRLLAQRGEIGLDTIVFDLNTTSVGALRAGLLELPARASWHVRLIDRHASTPA